MLLRRYHTPVEEAKAPDLEPGTLAETGQSAEDAAAATAQVVAGEQAEQAAAANADETGAQSVAPIIQEAGGVEDNPANDPTTLPVAANDSALAADAEPGNIDVVTEADVSVVEPVVMPEPEEALSAADHRKLLVESAGLTRNSSTADWQEFAGKAGDYQGDVATAKRDELAEFYMGPKAD